MKKCNLLASLVMTCFGATFSTNAQVQNPIDEQPAAESGISEEGSAPAAKSIADLAAAEESLFATDGAIQLSKPTVHAADKAKNLPRSVSWVITKHTCVGPPCIEEGATLTVFEDGRWFTKGIAVNRSRHAQWHISGRLYFRYNTSPHKVPELGEFAFFQKTMSHGSGWRKFPSTWKGNHRPFITHFDWILRADIDAWMRIHSSRTD